MGCAGTCCWSGRLDRSLWWGAPESAVSGVGMTAAGRPRIRLRAPEPGTPSHAAHTVCLAIDRLRRDGMLHGQVWTMLDGQVWSSRHRKTAQGRDARWMGVEVFGGPKSRLGVDPGGAAFPMPCAVALPMARAVRQPPQAAGGCLGVKKGGGRLRLCCQGR
jgi:hypothetical protein